jgi:hypothetical protein
MDIDNEWKNFLSCESGDFSDFDMNMNMKNQGDEEYNDFDDNQIEKNGYEYGSSYETCHKTDDTTTTSLSEAPQCTNIYISTKTKIAYLSKPIELKKIFWMIPIIQYSSLDTGVVKKQMKFNSTCQQELDEINEHLKKERLIDVFVITSINNTHESSNCCKCSSTSKMNVISTCQEELDNIKEHLTKETLVNQNQPVIASIHNKEESSNCCKCFSTSKIKFKDNRKISIGLCRKDIMTYKRIPKAAFFNCFVIILRVKLEETNKYKEFHVKLFNTGKIELPGIQNDSCLELVLQTVLDTLRPYMGEDLDYKKDTIETVLINSNFNCGYYVNRSVLSNILKYKYHIECSYDSCNYPGIQCKFYFNPDKDLKTQSGIQTSVIDETNKKYKNVKIISFMIFRTGSVLIVGKCDEDVLYIIYDKLKEIFKNEYSKIFQSAPDSLPVKNKIPKLRKKTLVFTSI